MKNLFFVFLFGLSAPYARAEIPVVKAVVVENIGDYIEEGSESNQVYSDCSWYCSDVVPTVSGSSNLLDKNDSYIPKKAHDFNFTTAWVEGKNDLGINEYLDYVFDLTNHAPKREGFGVDELVIFNGYWKNDALWSENGRVKKLEMAIDGKPTMIVELADVKKIQTVEFPLILLKGGEKKVLRFTIKDVYPGSKYKDTAISELLFDGQGAH